MIVGHPHPCPRQASSEEGGSVEGPSSRRLPCVRFEGTFGAVARPRAWCLGVRSSGPKTRRWARRPPLSVLRSPRSQ